MGLVVCVYFCIFCFPPVACSSNGMMTAVVDLSQMVQSGVNPARTSLFHKNCRPKETDGHRALYSFPLNSCGNTVKVVTPLGGERP